MYREDEYKYLEHYLRELEKMEVLAQEVINQKIPLDVIKKIIENSTRYGGKIPTNGSESEIFDSCKRAFEKNIEEITENLRAYLSSKKYLAELSIEE